MYKKIKNGSFMNLIWFIVAIIPILFILINNLDNKNKVINNLISYDTDYEKYENGEYFYTNNLVNYSFYIGDSEPFINDNIINVAVENNDSVDNTFYVNSNFDYYSNFYLYLYIEAQDNINTINLSYYDFYNVLQRYTISTNTFYVLEVSLNGNTDGFNIEMLGNDINNNYYIKVFLSSTEVTGFDLDNWVSQNNFYLLEDIVTSGFISNAFLNLAQLFGVTNVYYSLACYYIEYLLIIALLHLAFDVLYMLPNICHKFMEKIGGERD